MYVEVSIPYCTTQCNIINDNYTYTEELVDMLGVSLIQGWELVEQISEEGLSCSSSYLSKRSLDIQRSVLPPDSIFWSTRTRYEGLSGHPPITKRRDFGGMDMRLLSTHISATDSVVERPRDCIVEDQA